MAIKSEGKKSTLKEDAYIYEKRDKEEQKSERQKWREMNRHEKYSYFKSYYLKPLIIMLFVFLVIGYLIYQDFILKPNIILNVAVLNETIQTETFDPIDKEFTKSEKFDEGKNKVSFSPYYTTSMANEMGATAANDLTQISSMIYANALDVMISDSNSFNQYFDNGFFLGIDEMFTKDEMAKIKDYLYIPATKDNTNKRAFGIYLNGSEKYMALKGTVERPILGVLFNTENRERAKNFIYFMYPQIKEK